MRIRRGLDFSFFLKLIVLAVVFIGLITAVVVSIQESQVKNLNAVRQNTGY